MLVSLYKFMTETLLNSDTLPEEIRRNTCVANDSTLRAIRNSILEFGRAGVKTDEVSTTYECAGSEKQPGIHYCGRSKMVTFVSLERDTSATSGSHTDLATYQFLHYCLGQLDPIQEVCRPNVQGFTKCFHLIFPSNVIKHGLVQNLS